MESVNVTTVPRFRLMIHTGLLLAGCWLVSGCAQRHIDIEPRPGPVTDVLPAVADAKAEAVRADPIGYLRTVAANCSRLEQYTVHFTRYERRGLFQLMYGPEHIMCRFRRTPFSLHMKWLDEDIKYFESTYVAGRRGNKVRFITRWWSPPLKPPPGINEVELRTPIIWGEAKRPLTDWGLEQLAARTLASVTKAGDDVLVTYRGLLSLPQTGSTVHHLHLEYSGASYRVPIQELYIDINTDLPAGTILKLASDRIDAAYYYRDLNTDVALTDDDFLLSVERTPPVRTTSDEH